MLIFLNYYERVHTLRIENFKTIFVADRCRVHTSMMLSVTQHRNVTLKKKYFRATHSKFTSKVLSKEIMFRFKLRNKFLKDKTDEARTKCRKQRNICVPLLQRAKDIIVMTLT